MVDSNAQIDPLKIVARLREKLSSSQLQEAVLEALLSDANGLIMQLRELLKEREEELAGYVSERQGEENVDASGPDLSDSVPSDSDR